MGRGVQLGRYGASLAMSLEYLLLPLLAWLIAGSLKFVVNCFRARRLAFDLIGYGGFPSNHSAIVSSMCLFVGLHDGVDSAAFGVALTFAFIVIMDARSLRNQVGKQAEAINELLASQGKVERLRERIGHRLDEVVAGVIVGCTTAVVWSYALSLLAMT